MFESRRGRQSTRPEIAEPTEIELLAWDATGLELLRTLNSPEQKRYLGGPESEAKLADRQARYLTYHLPGDTEMLRIATAGKIVGSIGYWAIERPDGPAYEAGWELISEFQGQGIGKGALRAMLARLRPLARNRFVFAFPTPDNATSNGLCRSIGFELIGVEDFEYPLGTISPHNVWCFDLRPPA